MGALIPQYAERLAQQQNAHDPDRSVGEIDTPAQEVQEADRLNATPRRDETTTQQDEQPRS